MLAGHLVIRAVFGARPSADNTPRNDIIWSHRQVREVLMRVKTEMQVSCWSRELRSQQLLHACPGRGYPFNIDIEHHGQSFPPITTYIQLTSRSQVYQRQLRTPHDAVSVLKKRCYINLVSCTRPRTEVPGPQHPAQGQPNVQADRARQKTFSPSSRVPSGAHRIERALDPQAQHWIAKPSDLGSVSLLLLLLLLLKRKRDVHGGSRSRSRF